MIQKVTVTAASIKEGQTRDNKPYQMLGIKTDAHGEQWLSCFINQINRDRLTQIKAGDVVELVVEKKGDFLNFKLANNFDRLEARVLALEEHLFGGKQVTASEESFDPEF